MNMIIENKKVIVSFVSGLAVMGLIWFVSPKTSTLPNGQLTPAQIQARMAAQSAAQGRNPSASQRVMPNGTGMNPSMGQPMVDRPMPWDVAANFIEKAPVEKIEVSNLQVKLIMKGGATFTTTQPTKDAYAPLVKKSAGKIEVIVK